MNANISDVSTSKLTMPSRTPLLTVALLLAISAETTAALAQSPELTGLARAAGDKHPLSCIRVALEDSAGREVAFTRTDWRGLFAVAAPHSGVYRLRFDSPLTVPVLGPADSVSDGAYVERVYELPFTPLDSAARTAVLATDVELQPIIAPMPHYPDELRRRNVEGEAWAEFVIDTAGAVDTASIRIVRATQPELGVSVGDALRKTIFPPPRDRGAAACRRVIMPYEFRMVR